jgi:hypothetical protein
MVRADKEDTYSHGSSREEHKGKKGYAFHCLTIFDRLMGDCKVGLTVSLLNQVI